MFSLPDPKVVAEPAVVESDWLIQKHLGVDAEIGFLESLSEGAFVVESPVPADRARATELVAQYRDANIGYVDAVTVAIAERLKEIRIATFDRRLFLLIKPRHIDAFNLVP